jgi:hypothetical protein
MKKSKIMYIQPRDDGQPSQSITALLSDAAEYCFDGLRFQPGLTPLTGKGRRKVRITVTVEAV